MSTLIDLLLLALALAVAIPSLWFFIECVVGAVVKPAAPASYPMAGKRVAVLMPAHNESAGIEHTIRTLAPQLNDRIRLYVVADNCSDDTAARARACGATVFERHDAERRGKGFALAHGIEQLAANPPDVVIILDADCELTAGGLSLLAQQALLDGTPVQADYRVTTPSGRNDVRATVSALAFMVKNRVRPRGLDAMGQPCLLTGTGMAFPWAVLRAAPPTDDNLVEDMVMGLELALMGHEPHICPQVVVTSPLPDGDKAAATQRKRWEHGHMATVRSHVPRLLTQGLRQGRLPLITLALDLMVPPLSLLVLSVLGVVVLTAAAALLGATAAPLAIAVISFLAILTGVMSGWWAHGREWVRARDLMAIPLYVAWKLPLYVSFFARGKQKGWVRTERTPGATPPASADEPNR